MATPLRKPDEHTHDERAANTGRAGPGNTGVRHQQPPAPPQPAETETHGMERQPSVTSLGQDIRAHTNRPHKGDVGRPGTNEEVYQGSKQRELP